MFVGGGGGADVVSLPFVSGAISVATGVQSLQPFILALLAVLIILWLVLTWPGLGQLFRCRSARERS